ncbi:MAG: hypothetical protein WAV15_04605 [Minisyncoccia bacterium]
MDMDRFFAFLKVVEKLMSAITRLLSFPSFIFFVLLTGANVSDYVKTGTPTTAGLAATFALVAIYFAIDSVVCIRK